MRLPGAFHTQWKELLESVFCVPSIYYFRSRSRSRRYSRSRFRRHSHFRHHYRYRCRFRFRRLLLRLDFGRCYDLQSRFDFR